MSTESTSEWPGRNGISSFTVDGDTGIKLEQFNQKEFRLGTTIRYSGETGLEGFVADGRLEPEALNEARSVDPATLPETDLASVPPPLRWFVSRYGAHTPAALIHDRLIGDNEAPLDQITDPWADRYFRHMLDDLGVPWLRRWLMWAAVALGTRTRRGSASVNAGLLLWVLLSLGGIVMFGVSFAQGWTVPAILFALIPLPASLLWGKQWAAGLLAAYLAPLILPPTVFGFVAHVVYLLLEWIVSLVGSSKGAADARRIRFEDY